MTVTDELLANNATYAETFTGPLPLPPGKHVAVLACMDARIDVYGVLGLKEGEAHVIRNAGGVVTEDEIRSLAISQRPRHQGDRARPPHRLRHAHLHRRRLHASVLADTGVKPTWAAEAFDDLDTDVRQSLARIRASQFIPKTDVRGFVFDVATGRLSEVN